MAAASVGVASQPKIEPSTSKHDQDRQQHRSQRQQFHRASSPRSSGGSAGAIDGCSQARTPM